MSCNINPFFKTCRPFSLGTNLAVSGLHLWLARDRLYNDRLLHSSPGLRGEIYIFMKFHDTYIRWNRSELQNVFAISILLKPRRGGGRQRKREIFNASNLRSFSFSRSYSCYLISSTLAAFYQRYIMGWIMWALVQYLWAMNDQWQWANTSRFLMC